MSVVDKGLARENPFDAELMLPPGFGRWATSSGKIIYLPGAHDVFLGVAGRPPSDLRHSSLWIIGGTVLRWLSVAFGSVLVVALLLLASSGSFDPKEGTAAHPGVRALAGSELVADISPLPDEVSNGTWCTLDATNSTYSNGTIDHYYWEFYLKGVLKNIYEEPTFQHKFRQLGLWKITLTITTNDSKTATTFTAVYSVPDADADYLPDWWEVNYFNSTEETGGGDYDGDGYTNLQEYAQGTDPTVMDPGKSLLATLLEYWYYLVAIAAAAVVALVLGYPVIQRKRKAEVKKQIEAAIEIEKALEEDK